MNPIKKLDIICDKYKISPILYSPNMPIPTAPMTKIGPDVVQKRDIFFASVCDISFFS